MADGSTFHGIFISIFHAIYVLSFFCRESTAQSFKRKSGTSMISLHIWSWFLRLVSMHIGYGVVSVCRRTRNKPVSDAFSSEQEGLFHHITFIISDIGNRWWDLTFIIRMYGLLFYLGSGTGERSSKLNYRGWRNLTWIWWCSLGHSLVRTFRGSVLNLS